MKDKRVLYFIIIIESIILICLGGYRIYQYNNIKDLSNNDDVINDENNNDSIVEEDKDSINEDNSNDIKYYTVSFDSNGGNEIEDIKVKEGTIIKLPLPTIFLDGIHFDGWLLDDKKVDDEYIVNNDVVLKANWIKKDRIIEEYVLDKIEEVGDDWSSIKDFGIFYNDIKIKYTNSDIDLEVFLNNSRDSYVKVNGVRIGEYNNKNVKLFMFNGLYVILLGDFYYFSSDLNYNILILNSYGKLLKKIEVGEEFAIRSCNFLKEEKKILLELHDKSVYSVLPPYKIIKNVYEIKDENVILKSTNFYNDKIFFYNYHDTVVTTQLETEELEILGTYNCTLDGCKHFSSQTVVILDGEYYIYDYETGNKKSILKNIKSEILNIVDGYVIVVDDNELKVLDTNESVVAEFDYLPNAYRFDNAYINESGENIVISIYDYENDKYVNYYYNINTKESNIVR